MTLHVIEIINFLPADSKWKGLFTQATPPYYSLGDVDFWVNCRYIDKDDMTKPYEEEIMQKLAYQRELSPDEKSIVKAKSCCGVFSADVTDFAGLGQFDLQIECSNFIRVIKEGCMTPEELSKEAHEHIIGEEELRKIRANRLQKEK
jgi:hypothetical protein